MSGNPQQPKVPLINAVPLVTKFFPLVTKFPPFGNAVSKSSALIVPLTSGRHQSPLTESEQ